MEKRLFSIEEIAVYLGVSVSLIRKLVRSESIPFYRIGNRLKFDKKEIDEWLESNKHGGNKNRILLL